jgi:ABC-2 type transport system permease protein
MRIFNAEVFTNLTITIRSYFQFVRMGSKTIFVYRFNIFFQLFNVLFQIYLLKVVWTAIYIGRGDTSTDQLRLLIAYLTLANLQTWILVPNSPDSLQQRVRTGEVAFDIARPVDLIGQLLAQRTGTILGLIPFVIISFPLSLFVGELQLPASTQSWFLYVVSLILSYFIVSYLTILIGLISFWTLETTGLQLIYRFVNQLFAGTLIPISFFPPILHTIAILLPFQGVAFLPVSIYLGQLQGMQAFQALVTQFIWVIVLYILVKLVWYKAQRRILIQGG